MREKTPGSRSDWPGRRSGSYSAWTVPGLGWPTRHWQTHRGLLAERCLHHRTVWHGPSALSESGPAIFFPKDIRVCSRKSSTSAACLNRYVSPTFQEHSRDGLRKRLIMRPSFWSASGHRDETFLVFWSCDCCLVVFFGSRVFCVHTRVEIKTPIEKKHYPPRCQATSCNQ